MILVAGSANLDFVVRAPRIPGPGETVLGEDATTFPGGKGANQAIACARAGGVPTEMLLALGHDAFAAPIEDSLREANVRMHIVRVPERPTGTAFICVSEDGANAITVALGANCELRPHHLPPLHAFTHLLLQLETPLETVSAYARAARAQAVKVVLNAAPARPLPAGLLALLDVLVVSGDELATIAGRAASLDDAVPKLGVPCVVVTLGSRGFKAWVHGEWIAQPAFSVAAIDTTAAADAFCGVLAAGLHRRLSMRQALHEANAAAALACTRLGAQSSIPTHAELHAFLNRGGHSTP